MTTLQLSITMLLAGITIGMWGTLGLQALGAWRARQDSHTKEQEDN